jgi:hypothetical protein
MRAIFNTGAASFSEHAQSRCNPLGVGLHSATGSAVAAIASFSCGCVFHRRVLWHGEGVGTEAACFHLRERTEMESLPYPVPPCPVVQDSGSCVEQDSSRLRHGARGASTSSRILQLNSLSRAIAPAVARDALGQCVGPISILKTWAMMS